MKSKPAPKARKKKEVEEATVVSTVVEAGTVAEVPKETKPSPQSSETGPRSAGARRSSERERGRRRKTKSSD